MHPHQREIEQGGLGGTTDDWARVLEAECARAAARGRREVRLLDPPASLTTGARLLGAQVLLGVVGAGMLLVLSAVAISPAVVRGRRAAWNAGLLLAWTGFVLGVADVLAARALDPAALSPLGTGTVVCSAVAGLGALVPLTSRSARSWVSQRSGPRGRR